MTREEYREKIRKILEAYSDYEYSDRDSYHYPETQNKAIEHLTQLFMEVVRGAKPEDEDGGQECEYGIEHHTIHTYNSGFNRGISTFESNLLALFKGGEEE